MKKTSEKFLERSKIHYEWKITAEGLSIYFSSFYRERLVWRILNVEDDELRSRKANEHLDHRSSSFTHVNFSQYIDQPSWCLYKLFCVLSVSDAWRCVEKQASGISPWGKIDHLIKITEKKLNCSSFFFFICIGPVEIAIISIYFESNSSRISSTEPV